MNMEPKLNDEVARTAGAHEGPIETDAVIVGAGPVGLFQVFELGLLELPVKRGDYPLPSGQLTVRVLPIPILDGNRKKVTREIG